MDTPRRYLARKTAPALPPALEPESPAAEESQLSVSLCPHGLIHLAIPGTALQAVLTPEQAGALAMLLLHLERQAMAMREPGREN